MKTTIAILSAALLSLTSFASQHNDGVDPSKKIFNQWTKEYVNYPAESVKMNETGLVLVSFEISTEGEMENVAVESTLSEVFKQKAVEMVQAMPKEHLYANGFIEGTVFVLPVKFKID